MKKVVSGGPLRDRLTQADAGVLTGTELRAIYLCLEALPEVPPSS
jgi:hypothetical protein